MKANKNFRYILLTTNSGINKAYEILENSKYGCEVADYYNKYYIKKNELENLRNSVLESVPNAVEIRCFGSVGYAVPEEDYYNGLEDMIKILAESFMITKFDYEKKARDFNNKSKEYNFFCQNQFEFDSSMYDIMLNEINSYNQKINQKLIDEDEYQI